MFEFTTQRIRKSAHSIAEEKRSDLEKGAVEFIRDRCVGLRFKKGGKYDTLEDFEGKSLKSGQIPYNVQMDLDRRCLEVAVHRFMESGTAKDAFDIYYIYLEMYVGEYGKSKKMIEMLSEFESNASSLLMKHRDHYSHSVYVFLIGLAYYNSSKNFREEYKKKFGALLAADGLSEDNENDLAAHFLKYWGLTSLFHDIGYPFELSFEQMKSYYGDTIECVPFVSYNMNDYLNSRSNELIPKLSKKCCKILFDEKNKKENFHVGNMDKQQSIISELKEMHSNCAKEDYQSVIQGIDELEKNIEKCREDIKDYLSGYKPESSFAGFDELPGIILSENDPEKLREIKKSLDNAEKELSAEYKNLSDIIIGDKNEKNTFKIDIKPRDEADSLIGMIKDMTEMIKLRLNISEMLSLTAEKRKSLIKLRELLPENCKDNANGNINSYFADVLNNIIGEDYRNENYNEFARKGNGSQNTGYRDFLLTRLSERNDPSKCNGFIDHAYFSAVTLTVNLIKNIPELNEMYSYAISAILIHNSFYKFVITNYTENGKDGINTGNHFTVQKNPLAFLLMLCDEIQCWDRTSYGRNSRGQVHPMDCKLKFEDNKITAEYIFDAKYAYDNGGVYVIKDIYRNQKGTYKKLYTGEFLREIEYIVSINGDKSLSQIEAKTEFEVKYKFAVDERYRKSYLSNSNFIHLYNFACMVHQMNHPEKNISKMEDEFNSMSLEYKINHISRAKKYASFLDKIGCFYSDKSLDFEVITEIKENYGNIDSDLDEIGAHEHDRWCFEHYVMGWRALTSEENEKLGEKIYKDNRERLRIHKDMIELDEHGRYHQETALGHYRKTLSEEDRLKDKRSINNLLRILNREDGIKVYRLKTK